MATLKAVIRKDKMKTDKTWNVLIRLTHARQVRYISTTMYVTKKDLTSRYEIKNQMILDKCTDLIKEYRKRISPLNLELNDIPIDNIVRLLKLKDTDEQGISFTAFFADWCARNSRLKGLANYHTAFNALCRFFQRREISCSDITANTLRRFEESLSGRMRSVSSYTSTIVRLFNAARDYYNDEDNGIILIRHSLRKYKPPRQNIARKRSLTLEQIRAIFALPASGLIYKGRPCARDIALDCFKLSFCLLGMNAVDMYEVAEYDGESICYYRAKTRDRRADRARMEVRVPEMVRGLLEKYKGQSHVFNFSEVFTIRNFRGALTRGIKEVGKEIGLPDLQFYAARHTMATLAANEAGIDRWTVNLMLNHTDSALSVTELYIRRDFRPINDANARLLEYVFGKNDKNDGKE